MTMAPVDGRFDVDRATFDALVAHARSDFPYEVCGLLAVADGRIVRHWPIRNAERSLTYYAMDSRQLLAAMREIDDAEWGLAIYHSHTHTEAYPSATDIRIAAYPEAVYLIVSLQDPQQPVLRAFNIVDGAVTERTVRIDGELAEAGSR